MFVESSMPKTTKPHRGGMFRVWRAHAAPLGLGMVFMGGGRVLKTWRPAGACRGGLKLRRSAMF